MSTNRNLIGMVLTPIHKFNLIAIIFIFTLVNFYAVSYPNQKVHLQWDDAGVVLNPELKLLQYNLGQPLEVAESIGYMPEKHGKNEYSNAIVNLAPGEYIAVY